MKKACQPNIVITLGDPVCEQNQSFTLKKSDNTTVYTSTWIQDSETQKMLWFGPSKTAPYACLTLSKANTIWQ